MNQPSLDRLNQCHPDLIKLILRVDQIYPIQVICGFRGEKEQNIAFENKKSKLKFPNSKHNHSPSLAVDVVPDPDRNTKTISWMDLMAFEIMCLAIELVADDLEIKVRLGRDFTFKDWPHVELINKK